MLDNLVIKKYLRLEKPKNLISGKRVYDETGETVAMATILTMVKKR